MTFLQAYLLLGIPLILLALAGAALLWVRWDERSERRRNLPGE